MKSRRFWILIGLMVWASAAAAEAKWLVHLSDALGQAKEQKRWILMNFTGSDYCIWCQRFQKDVLSRPEFKAYAEQHLVLLEVDFPERKKQSAELKKANEALQEKYAVAGFPTFVLLNSEGREVGRQVGYLRGGPEAFLRKLDGFRK